MELVVPEHELTLLTELTVDPAAEPNFEILKYCLIWPDERPLKPLSAAGAEFLADLWIVRGFIHRGLPEHEWGLDPQYFADVWEFGLANVEGWIGFKRLVLNAADCAYLTAALNTDLSTF